jgi:hypothetical protein
MSETNDQLFLLIKSLSKSEKRYLKLHTSKHDGPKDYIELFDVIDHLKEYDETKIREKLKGKEFLKHLAVIKNYLFNAIIDCLHEYSSYDTAEYKLEELLKKIKVIQQKGLIDLCNRYIEKAKRIASDHELFFELIKLLTIQHQISTQNSSFLFKKRKEIQQELKNAAEKSHNLSEYLQLELNTGYYINSQRLPIDSPEISELLKHPLLAKKEMALSGKALMAFLKIHAKICEYKGEKNEAFYYAHEILKLMEAGNIQPSEDALIYARTINTYLQSAIDIRQFENFEHYISVLKNLFSKKLSAEQINIIKGFYYINLIHKNIVFGDFIRVIEIIHGNNEELLGNQLMPIKFRIFILYFECVAFIGIKEYKAALKIINTSLSLKENVLSAIRRISRILNILIHYELENGGILMNEIETTGKYIHELENNGGEKLIIKHIKSLIDCKDTKEQIACFKTMKDDLIAMEKNTLEAINISYFDFLSWVESKIEKRPFQEIVKEKALKPSITSPLPSP